MRIRWGLKIVVIVLAISGIIGFLIFGFQAGRKEQALEQEGERPIKAPLRVSVVQGETVVTLDEAAQKTSGIVTAALVSGSFKGRAGAGVIVPDSAVVWLDGKAWVYIQEGPERFVRKELSTTRPAAGGWLVEKNILPGERVVAQGAQLLLSEEFRSQIQMGD